MSHSEYFMAHLHSVPTDFHSMDFLAQALATEHSSTYSCMHGTSHKCLDSALGGRYFSIIMKHRPFSDNLKCSVSLPVSADFSWPPLEVFS